MHHRSQALWARYGVNLQEDCSYAHMHRNLMPSLKLIRNEHKHDGTKEQGLAIDRCSNRRSWLGGVVAGAVAVVGLAVVR